MSEDTPDDEVHSLLRGAVPRPPARARGARRRSTPSSARRATRSPGSSRALPAGQPRGRRRRRPRARRRRRRRRARSSTASTPARAADARGARRPRAEPLVVHRRRPSRRTSRSAGGRSTQRDPDRYALAVANQVLGGGMSSRLFQEIREERGLAYTVYSGSSLYTDCGLLVAYAGTAPNKAREVTRARRAAGRPARRPTASPTRSSRSPAATSSARSCSSLEDSGSRMGRLGA